MLQREVVLNARSTSLSVRSNYVFHANSGSSRKVSAKVKATIYTIPDNLLLVNHLIWCGYCCRPDTQCKLAPWAKCKGAKVNINRQALELLMKEECPEFMDVQLSETVCYSEAKCGVCAESLAGKVMVIHPALKVMLHKDCWHTVDFKLNPLSPEAVVVIMNKQEAANLITHSTQRPLISDAVVSDAGLNLVPETTETVESTRIQKRQEKYDSDMMQSMRNCVDGKCSLTVPKEENCRSCGRGLHGVSCGLASANLALGVFKCGQCRFDEMSKRTDFSAAQNAVLMSQAWATSKGSISAFAVKSYQASEGLLKLIRTWQDTVGVITDPRYNESALCMFLRWNCVDHARSLKSTVRGLHAHMIALSIPDITKYTEVRWTIKELTRSKKKHGYMVMK